MRKNPILTAVSIILITTGIASVGFAVTQIQEMRVSSSSQVLPELTALPISSNSPANSVAFIPARGDYIGSISMPALKKTLPIFQGTEDGQLKKGVGHYEGSVLPGVRDNSVLAGHRDSVFSQLGKLKLGDLLIVNTATGNYTYKVARFRIVQADDRTVIVPTKNAVLTLSTCYPFRYFGNAPKRFIVSANLIETPEVVLALGS
ncbi:MAG: class D sortase [Actinomycetota bacterium]